MFFEEDFAKKLSDFHVTEKTSGIYLAFEMHGSLKKLKKRMKKTSFIPEKAEDEAMWLKENFPRLEQAMREDIKALLRLRCAEGKGKYPYFYSTFKNTLCKSLVQTEEQLKKVFFLCNNYGGGIDYNNSLSLAVLFRAAVEMRLCELFVLMLEGKEMNNGKQISSLFCLLDLLLSTNSESILADNRAEKILLSEKSKIYSKLTDETKKSYRRNLTKIAKKKKLSQQETARLIVERVNNGHIGEILADKSNMGYSYLLVLLFLTLSFTALLLLVSPIFILFVIPIYYSTNLVLDKFFCKYLIKPYVLPQIKLESVPEKCGVMTVITTLLFGEREDEKIFNNLEKSYLSCSGENVYFGLLADLPDSHSKNTAEDEKIIENANLAIRKLRQKYGNVFFLFVREREWSDSEEKYIAPERKRGAVCSLAAFLCGKNDDFAMNSIKPAGETSKNIKYILTLDADTNLGFDCITELVGIGIHPQNEPVFDKRAGVVTRGYGIIQPQVCTRIDSAGKNYFTRVMCAHAGIDNYNFGGSDKNMSLFGQSFFCGKGLIEKNVFYNALCGKNSLEKNSVLSHDSVEGALIRCAFTDRICFSDSYPSQMLSYFKRKHRWLRGDFQNIPYLLSCIKDVKGKKRIVKHSVFSRFFIFQNIICALVPVFCLSMLLYSPFCTEVERGLVITTALSNLILPFVNTVLSIPYFSLWQNLRRVFYSKDLYTGIWTCFMQMLFCISALPKTAYVSLDALIRVIYRKLITRKKMLEWTTFSQSDAEAKDGLLGYVKNNLVCAVCGTYLFVLTDNGLLKILSMMWFFCPYFAYRFSITEKGLKELTQRQKQTLCLYCRDMWRFFQENVGKETHHLPPDNMAFLPKAKLADYTSPTNIGFYILCMFVARKMGFIDSKELEQRLHNTLEEIATLPKFRGLLYNWYNVNRAEVLKPEYVSSVDIGNYLACLICAKEALEEFADEMKDAEIIKQRLTELLKVDISPLYDREKNLFFIGAVNENGELKKDKNHYDMLMSEARILSFVCVANRSIPVHHIKCLSRPFTESKRHIGLASWSGTAFEYFLPEIFIKSKEGSLLYEALSFSYNCAKRRSVATEYGRAFGISESLYNEFDENGNYKYFAFGTAENALRVTDEKKVISPYSGFLFLPMSKDECLRSLSVLKKLGCYGKYGFYDSYDFEKGGVVKSVMSHHIGMSMCAAANELYEGVVREWFKSDKRMLSCLELADEKLPYDIRIKRLSRRIYDIKTKQPRQAKKRIAKPTKTDEKHQKECFCIGENIYCTANKNALLKTVFPKTNRQTAREKIAIENDYDLIENCSDFSESENAFVYGGCHKGREYSVEAFCHSHMPLKIIKTLSPDPPEFTLEFCQIYNCKIGAGAVFAQAEENLYFCFGFSKTGREIVGADYVINNKIKAYFSQKSIKADEYVFCIGSCRSLEEMTEIQSYVWEKYDKFRNQASTFGKSLAIDNRRIPKEIKKTFEDRLCFPSDKRITRLFCRDLIGESERLALLVLSVFTEYGCDKRTVLEVLERQYRNPVLNLLGCLLFSAYVNCNNDISLGEEIIKNQTSYRLFLEKLFHSLSELRNDEEYWDICMSYTEIFAKTCNNLSDMRMAQKILDCKQSCEW